MTHGLTLETWSDPYVVWRSGLQQNRFLIQKCVMCGHEQFPLRACCRRCSSATLRFTPLNGREGVVAATTTQYRGLSGGPLTAPYRLAMAKFGSDIQVLGLCDEDVCYGASVVATKLTRVGNQYLVRLTTT